MLLDFPGCFEYQRPCINSSQVGRVEHRRPGSGRRRVSTPEQNAALVAEAVRNPFQSASAIRTNSQFPESTRTALRRSNDEQLFAPIAAKKELLKDEHKLFRLAFPEENTNRNWNRVIFSDEVTFSSTNGGKVIVYHPRGARYYERYVAKQIRRGCVSRTGKTHANMLGKKKGWNDRRSYRQFCDDSDSDVSNNDEEDGEESATATTSKVQRMVQRSAKPAEAINRKRHWQAETFLLRFAVSNFLKAKQQMEGMKRMNQTCWKHPEIAYIIQKAVLRVTKWPSLSVCTECQHKENLQKPLSALVETTCNNLDDVTHLNCKIADPPELGAASSSITNSIQLMSLKKFLKKSSLDIQSSFSVTDEKKSRPMGVQVHAEIISERTVMEMADIPIAIGFAWPMFWKMSICTHRWRKNITLLMNFLIRAKKSKKIPTCQSPTTKQTAVATCTGVYPVESLLFAGTTMGSVLFNSENSFTDGSLEEYSSTDLLAIIHTTANVPATRNHPCTCYREAFHTWWKLNNMRIFS
ncbi:hypothetical protein C0J52_10822 [Blattella germanica]|nr:hypothetical protein C0J52_10822 [Blattella germanica]